MPMTVIIPLKALASAKGRLAPALSPAHRRDFVAWMARRVIAACQACEAVEDILVVAGDESAADVARGAGVDVVVVPQPGLDAALGAADSLTRDSDSTLVVAADLPQLTEQDLFAVVAAAAATSDAAVVVAPTHDGGTGALLRRPPGVIATAYGDGSAAEHERRGRAVGASTAIVRRPGLAADVDTPAELPAALALVAGQHVGSASESGARPASPA
ncbi:MAG: 2-phospho-L-lactate guanylyltransferase [Nitriliruptorales bacterium]|nr:2-phospho-L-lactate guanylyltransferase [Nitriliruptorales bacterium]